MSESTTASGADAPTPKRNATRRDKPGMFSRLALFIRQVIAELRKVIWPTRKELVTYTWVVLVFVIAFALMIALVDLAAGRAVFALFGD